MKRLFTAICLVFLGFNLSIAQVIISTNPASTPSPGAMLEIESLDKGLLIPRMNMAARNLISLPATGLLIYQIDNSPGFYYYDGGAWVPMDKNDNDWVTSGTTVYNTGSNIGIGTSTPAATTHIDGTGSKLLVGASGGVLSKLTVNAETGLEIARFRSNGSTKVIIKDNGDVGIGAAIPSAKLDVIGSTELNGSLKLVDGSQAAGLVLRSDAAGSASWQDLTGIYDDDWVVSGIDVYRAGGEVGIGTTTPGAALHIKQEGTAIGDGFRLESATSYEDWYTYMDVNDDYVLRNDASNFLTVQKNTGNVAIGTVFASGYRLSVDGKMAVEEILIDASGYWPDYVFAEDYDLLSIDEFAATIKKNKHLPGIPSATEVEENGVLIGDMQKRTIEKIEELSLYIIQLHDRMTALEKENARLKAMKTQ